MTSISERGVIRTFKRLKQGSDKREEIIGRYKEVLKERDKKEAKSFLSSLVTERITNPDGSKGRVLTVPDGEKLNKVFKSFESLGIKDGYRVEADIPGLDNKAEDPQSPIVNNKEKTENHSKRSKAGKTLAAAGLTTVVSLSGLVHEANATNIPSSVPVHSGIHESIPNDFQTSQKAYRENVVRQESNVSNNDKTPKVEKRPEALNPAESALWNLTHLADGTEITLEYMQQHPQDIRDIKTKKDENGNVTNKHILIKKDDGAVVYKTSRDLTGKFTEREAIGGKIPIKHPLSVAVSLDGKAILVGGAEDIGGAPEKLFIFYTDAVDKKWKEIPYPLMPSGGVQNLEPISEGIFFGNPSGYEQPQVQPFFVYVDQVNKSETIKAASIETIQPATIESGSIKNFNPSTLSINALSKEMDFWSAGSDTMKDGINHYKINYDTRQGSVENIKTVKVVINGAEQDVNIGYIYGLTFYTDANGVKHALAANGAYQNMFDIDLTTKKATMTYYGNWLNNKKIPGLRTNGSLIITKLHAMKDNQGKVNVWFGGGFLTDINGNGGDAIVGNYVLGNDPVVKPETLTEYSSQLHTAKGRSAIYEKNMEWEKYNGQTGFRFKLYPNLGEGFLPVNPDGNPLPDARIIFPNDGLGSNPVVDPTPTPSLTPTPEPLSYKVFLPVVPKGNNGGW